MAEKGGKQFPVSRGKTCAVKKKAPLGKDTPLKGKDGSVQRRTVTFDNSSDSEGSPRATAKVSGKSNGKVSFETPVSKGDWGKGGKGDKAGKAGGKSAAPKIPSTPKFEIETELPKNASCLMDCEAEVILQGIQEQLVILSEDPKLKIPGSFDKGLQYAKSGCYYTNPQSARKVLEKLKKNNVSNGEICLIGNISPENADELLALMPSLKDKRTKTGAPIENVLSDLAKLKSSR